MEEKNIYLLGALENILGKSIKKSKANAAFHCPFCNHRKPKLEINLATNSKGENQWACWVCGTKGRTIKSLLRYLNISYEEAKNVLQYVRKGEEEDYEKPKNVVRLPDEFQPLHLAPVDSVEANRFRSYLYARGLTDNDFIRYSIGYCTRGKYENRVIIPSFDQHNCLNYFVARSLDPEAFLKYLNPDVEKDQIIAFENTINWNQPIILCEGTFDAMSLRRNSIPLLGKIISTALMKKIIESPLKSIYLLLDKDALKASLKHCETFLNMGKKVYLVIPEGKDPSEMGFKSITQQLQKAKELTFTDLIQYKLEI